MIKWLRRWKKSLHVWEYRNPFDRTCSVCGRHEVKYCNDIKDARDPFSGWWEVYSDGDAEKHKG